MKLLLDQGTPRSAAFILRQLGIDAIHTGEIGLAEALDTEIIFRALEEDRIVVTFDADFHMILALSKAKGPSVIRIRIQGLKSDEFCDLIQKVMIRCSDDLNAGSVVSVNDQQIRIRRLPLT